MRNLYEEYARKMCPYCKAECDKGIVLIRGNQYVAAKCIDYEKDKEKIEGYKRPIYKTAI